MEKLTKEEYKSLLNDLGKVARFYIEHIEDIKNNIDFNKAFSNINQNRDVTIDDNDYYYSTPYRLICRGNETIYLAKDIKSIYPEYQDTIVYFLTVDFNKKIKMYIDYNMLERNENNTNEIYFEILTNYEHTECGDIYGDGRIVNNEEIGYKGKISTINNECILEYGRYEYNDLTVTFPGEVYKSNNPIPKLEDLNTETVTYRLTKGVNNPVFLAHNEIQEKIIRSRQRIR